MYAINNIITLKGIYKGKMRIKRLPEGVINKIAAGEVIDRPSGVLKELIENSLDAKADRIQIKVEKGGKKLIEVRDNGSGIHPDDILETVKRHSTSKINDIDDLYSINSYGFRGEALSSISSVSKFSIISRQKDFPLGKELFIEGGVFRYLSDTGAPTGTVVRVRDLFFNVPARERFLKSERTELKHITDVFLRYAVCRPDVGFVLQVDDRVLYNLLPSTMEERLKNIFPKAENFMYFEGKNSAGKTYGYVSSDIKAKGFIYVNGRPVRNSLLSRIIRSKVGENFFAVFIELPPYFVDHNIHPAKIDVRFRKEKPVYDLVKSALDNISKPKLHLSVSQPKVRYNAEFKILGQIENTFLVVYYDGDVYFIDQHVASERINYELLLRKYRSGNIPAEKSNLKLDLTTDQVEKLKELKENLEKLGVVIRKEKNQFYIKQIPSFSEGKDIKKVIYKILNSEYPEIEIESFLAELACDISIEAGDILSDEEAKSLLKVWIETDNPNLCPHGRPIYYKIPVENIKKKVGRK